MCLVWDIISDNKYRYTYIEINSCYFTIQQSVWGGSSGSDYHFMEICHWDKQQPMWKLPQALGGRRCSSEFQSTSTVDCIGMGGTGHARVTIRTHCSFRLLRKHISCLRNFVASCLIQSKEQHYNLYATYLILTRHLSIISMLVGQKIL